MSTGYLRTLNFRRVTSRAPRPTSPPVPTPLPMFPQSRPLVLLPSPSRLGPLVHPPSPVAFSRFWGRDSTSLRFREEGVHGSPSTSGSKSRPFGVTSSPNPPLRAPLSGEPTSENRQVRGVL